MKQYTIKLLSIILQLQNIVRLYRKKKQEESNRINEYNKIIEDYSEFCAIRFLKNNHLVHNSNNIDPKDYPRTLLYKK